MFWDGCTLNHFVIYHFDEKYQCLLISYKLTLFQQKQEQQQPVIDFENGVIFSPERRSKVVKFAKNHRLNALIDLARDEQFLFSP